MNMLASTLRLHRHDLHAIEKHLSRLSAEDLSQRFGHSVSPESIERYVLKLEFETDAHFGIYDHLGEHLLAYAHLALDLNRAQAELGLSVLPNARRNGFAESLLQRSVLHARNLALSSLIMHFLPYNQPLIELARKSGMRVRIEHGDGVAEIANSAPDWGSFSAEAATEMGDGALRSVQHMACATLAIGRDWCVLSGSPADKLESH